MATETKKDGKGKTAKQGPLDEAGRAKAAALATKVLRQREPKDGKVECLTCKELDAICTAVGLKPNAQRAYVRRALRAAGLHPAQGATGEGRLVAVKTLK
jgi:hypothetical protein